MSDSATVDSTSGASDDDYLVATDDGDKLIGGSGDDTLVSGEGDDFLNGGSGTDTAVYGDFRDYLVLNEDGNYQLNLEAIRKNQVTLVSADGSESDILQNIEQLLFENGQSDLYDEFTYVIGQNNAVLTGRDTGSLTEDEAQTFDVIANDYDLDGDSFTLIAATTDSPGIISVDAAAGTVSFNAAGHYNHLAVGETETVVITYTVQDIHGLQSSSTLTLTLTGVNDAPVAITHADFSATEDGAVINSSVSATDVDNGAVLTYSLTEPAPAGFAFYGDGSYSFDPSDAAYQSLADGETTQVSFSWIATDEHGASTEIQTVNITLTGTNDAPVAVVHADFSATEDGAVINNSVSATDVDNGAVLTYSLTEPAPAGFTFNGDGSYSFDPSDAAYQSLADGETTQVSFSWIATDEHGASTEIQTVNITLTGTNDAPVAVVHADFSATEDGAVINSSVSATDVDNGAVLTYSLTEPAPAGFTFNGDGSYSFDPSDAAYQSLADGEATQVSFSWIATDEHGASTEVQTVNITLTGTNDAPVAVVHADFSATEDGAVINSSVSATDVDNGAVLTYSLTEPAPAGFTFKGDGRYSFDPSDAAYQSLADGDTTQVSFSWIATDQQGASSAEQTVTITITGTNDAPVAEELGDQSAVEDGPILSSSVSASDLDSGAVLEYLLTSTAPEGLTFNSDGSFSFDPSVQAYQSLAQDETLTVSFSWQATDEHGAASAEQTVNILITGTNDVPVAVLEAGFETTEGSEIIQGQLQAIDVDNGAVLTYRAVGDLPAGFTLNADGSYSFDPSAADFTSLSSGETQALSFSWEAVDEHGAVSQSDTVNFTITGVGSAESIGYVVSWVDQTFTWVEEWGAYRSDGYQIKYQSFDHSGQPLGQEQIMDVTDNYIYRMESASSTDGSFMLAYMGYRGTLKLQLISSDGEPLGGLISIEARLSTFNLHENTDGTFSLYYTPQGSSYPHRLDIDSLGNPMDEPQQVEDTVNWIKAHTENFIEYADGSISWAGNGYDNGSYVLTQWRYDSEGVLTSTNQLAIMEDDVHVQVAAEGYLLESGETLYLWKEFSWDGYNNTLYLQKFDEGMQAVGEKIAVPIETNLWRDAVNSFELLVHDSGEISVFYEAGNSYPDFWEIYVQRYDANLEPIGELTKIQNSPGVDFNTTVTELYESSYSSSDTEINTTTFDELFSAEEGIAEIFIYEQGDTGTDTIQNFNAAEGDVLHLADLISSDLEAGFTVDQLLEVTSDGVDTTVTYDAGNDDTVDQAIILEGVDLVQTDTNPLATLIGNGTIEEMA